MTDKPAVVQGCYVDCRFMPGLKSARISIDIPIEHANEFLRMFGAPDRAAPVSVVIARLADSPAEPLSGVSRAEGPNVAIPELSPVQRRKPFRDHPRVTQAGMLCEKREFQQWLTNKYPTATHAATALMGLQVGDYLDPKQSEDLAARVVRAVCGIKSRAELDDNKEAGNVFDLLRDTYEVETKWGRS